MPSISKIVAWRTAGKDLQERFAELSGDRNPMHMDPVAARRTQPGAPVVHGVHTLLWALESLVETGYLTDAPLRIKARFLKWVYLEDETVLSLSQPPSASSIQIQVDVLGLTVLSAEILQGEPTAFPPAPQGTASPEAPLPLARDLGFAELENLTGDAFTAPLSAVEIFFPRLSQLIGPTAVTEIVACSYIVGMEAPGLHSMFSRLDLTFSLAEAAQVREALGWKVAYLDERFRKGRIAVAGRAIAGTLEVFIRVPPVRQPAMEVIAEHVAASEFAGMHALIVGGSRGLGELTAKLIAAGGGSPVITYASGKVEAEDVVGQIRAAGGICQAIPYDVRQSPDEQIASLELTPTHLFYFATGTIYKPKLALLSPSILADFTQFYLQGFYDLCITLTAPGMKSTRASEKLVVLYPSTVFIESRPAGMTEYAMIKAAGEQLCADMNVYVPDIQIVSPRLPKLATDQTAGVVPERSTDAIDALLPILRGMKAASTIDEATLR
jgi:hypothetical protein